MHEDRHQLDRVSIRLKEFDYSSAASYFITICTPTLGEIGAFKSITTNRYIDGVKNQNWVSFDRRLWQRNYYEHIIRNDRSFEILQSYIQDNPLRWEIDRLHPDIRSKW